MAIRTLDRYSQLGLVVEIKNLGGLNYGRLTRRRHPNPDPNPYPKPARRFGEMNRREVSVFVAPGMVVKWTGGSEGVVVGDDYSAVRVVPGEEVQMSHPSITL